MRVLMIGGDVPFYAKNSLIVTHHLQNADFQSIFARSATAVTPSKKVQLTLLERQLRTVQ